MSLTPRTRNYDFSSSSKQIASLRNLQLSEELEQADIFRLFPFSMLYCFKKAKSFRFTVLMFCFTINHKRLGNVLFFTDHNVSARSVDLKKFCDFLQYALCHLDHIGEVNISK